MSKPIPVPVCDLAPVSTTRGAKMIERSRAIKSVVQSGESVVS